MNSKQIQAQCYNRSLKDVERINKELEAIYNKAKIEIEKKIALLKVKAEAGLLNQYEKLRMDRLNAFIKSITSDLTIVKAKEMNILIAGYVDNYSNAYYGNAYAITYDTNMKLLANSPYSYMPAYRKLNTSYIAQSYNDQVAMLFGKTLKEKSASEILAINAKIRQAVTQAIAEGISSKELAKRFKDSGLIIDQYKRQAQTVARTELLRGYSYGNQDAIDEAIYAGIEGYTIWDSTLDGKTRPTHQQADQTRADEEGFFTIGGFKTRGARMEGLPAKESVNCRCRTYYSPIDIEPNSRGYRSSEGKWLKTNKNMEYMEWAETLEGKLSIEAQAKRDKARAKKLAEKRK